MKPVAPARFASCLAGLAALVAVGAWDAARAGEGTAADAGKAEAEADAVTPEWDQVATLRGAADRLGRLHRAKGAKAAYDLIDACYRTHGLSSTYGEGFEICIVQDYLETRTLMKVYSRMPPDVLEKLGVPSPDQLAHSMRQRVANAFGQYGKSQAYADNLRQLVDEHGAPVFLAHIFPEAAQRGQAQEKSKSK